MLPFILDTDIGSDVDDALALAFALRHPELELRAVTTVSGDTIRRARIAKKLLLLAGRDDIEVAAGVSGDTPPDGPQPEGGHEDAMLGEVTGGLPVSARDAVTLLLEEAGRGGCEIATVGMQSNMAAAVARDPAFAERVPRLTVMGGVFAPVQFLNMTLPPSVDHNLNVDQQASVVALNIAIPKLFVPCDVTMGAWLTTTHLDRLRAGDALCRELARQIDIWTVVLHRSARGAVPEHYVALLHDPLAVACMVDRRFVTSVTARVTVAMHEGHVRTFIDPAAGHEAEIITSVDAPAFAQFWLDMVLA
ncbi:MAG: nucleoside hydrolase [Chloroflexota bacterium]|nr:nucleoside hydrolase [Chloroflexota bacterium]